MNTQRTKDLAISMLAVGVMVAACGNKMAQRPQQDPSQSPDVIMFSVPGSIVPKCDAASRPISRVVLVHLYEDLDDMINSPARRVYFKAYNPNNSTPDDDNLNDIANGSDAPSNWIDDANETNDVDNAVGTAVVPYSIDTGQMGNSLPTGSWTQIRFLLRDDGSAGASKLIFYKSKDADPTKVVRGITVDNSDIVNGEVCVDGDQAAHDNHGASVLSVYIQTPSAATKKHYQYTLILRAKNGAISTPITIDPKIYNNG